MSGDRDCSTCLYGEMCVGRCIGYVEAADAADERGVYDVEWAEARREQEGNQ